MHQRLGRERQARARTGGTPIIRSPRSAERPHSICVRDLRQLAQRFQQPPLAVGPAAAREAPGALARRTQHQIHRMRTASRIRTASRSLK